jgi:hypothetical protein
MQNSYNTFSNPAAAPRGQRVNLVARRPEMKPNASTLMSAMTGQEPRAPGLSEAEHT